MAVATKTLDRQLHKLLAKQSGFRVHARAAFLAGHRYEMRNPHHARLFWYRVNQSDYLRHKVEKHVDQWLTVVKRVTFRDRPFLLVRLNANRHLFFLVPFLALPIGTQVRGWLELRHKTTSASELSVLTARDIRVVLTSSVGMLRLVTEAFRRAYPRLRVTGVFRVPGQATFVHVEASTANGRRRCYSPATKQYIQQLFYRHAVPPTEAFHLILATEPYPKQIAHLLGVRPDHVRAVDSGVYVVKASGHRVRMLAPLAAQFLGCTIRVRA